MNHAINDRKAIYPENKKRLLQEQLINQMVLMWGGLSLIGITLTNIRALEIGWTTRDFIQTVVVIGILCICLNRHKLSTYFKANILVTVNIIIGVIGAYTLGMLAASVFFFPMGAIILALLYSKRSVIIFAVLSVAFYCFIAVSFSLHYLQLSTRADLLISNQAHWGVYILAYTFFFVISCVTIFNYRRTMEQLIIKVDQQREMLEESNAILEAKSRELMRVNKQLALMANSDALTGISNRRHMDDHLNNEWQRAIRNHSSISFILMDIDCFKQYNDSYGHPQGDECLKKVARALNEQVNRSTDLVARYGGEEFAIILCDTDNAEFVAEKCRQAIEQLKIPHDFSNVENVISISVGLFTYHPENGSTPGFIFDRADKALYKAKMSGKNKVCVFKD
ncbi:MAG: diguanylate cyclase [Methyloprofundus sp.]|nr:diguanylate cyclase [Methyloprofundus sp.]